jgi:fused signal recognition particle receptor
MALFDIFNRGLQKTRMALSRAFEALSGERLDPAALENLEAALLGADLGPALALELAEQAKRSPDAASARAAVRAQLLKRLCELQPCDGAWPDPRGRPDVTLLLGVNGSGKTTTTGKLAARYRSAGETVLLGAADTFRAAAIQQLQLWAERTGADIVRQGEGADPAAVAFDTVARGVAGGYTRVLIDTAGRLQTKSNLMEELKKIHRVVGKAQAGAPHHVWLVLDASSGQNMVSQARLFHAAVPLTGLVVTKLDGSAKAGAVLAVLEAVKVPVVLMGLGEGAEDLRPFEREAFVAGLVG